MRKKALILLSEHNRFGNQLIPILYCLNRFGKNIDIYMTATKYIKPMSELFSPEIHFYGYDYVPQKIDFSINDCWNMTDIPSDLFKADGFIGLNYLKYKYKDIYQLVKDKSVLHLRGGDYNSDKCRENGYHVLDDRHIQNLVDNYKVDFVIGEDVWRIREVCDKYGLIHLNYGDYFLDWLCLFFCKTVFASASTFSILGGVLGLSEKVIAPYPYIINNDGFNKIHEFLYNSPKIVKIMDN